MKKFQAFIKEVAEPKAGDEKRFKDKHIVNKTNYPGHDDDPGIYNGTKKSPAKKKRLADLEKGKDEEVYEEHDGEDNDDDDDDDECPECGGEDGEHEEDCSMAEGMDPVNQKALKKKFSDRKDKDIDNDGDVDSSDEYLHKRRKAISKAVKVDEAKNYEIKNGKIHISKANFRKVSKDYKNATKGKERMMALDPKTGATTSFEVVFTEEVVAEAKMSASQIDALKKAYEPMRGKRISVDNANKLMAIMDKVKDDKNGLIQLYKADIPFVSMSAATRLMKYHNMKPADLKKEEVVSEAASAAEMKKILKIIGPTKNAQQGIAAIKKALKVSDKKAEELLDAAIKHSLGESHEVKLDEKKGALHLYDNEADARKKAKEVGGKVIRGVGKSAGKWAVKEEVLDEAQKLFMFKTKQEADQKAKEIKGKVLALGPKNFAVVTMDLTVVKEAETQFLAQFLLDEGINVDDLTEEQLDELIGAVARGVGAVARGAGRLVKKAVVNKHGNIRLSARGRQDAKSASMDKKARRAERDKEAADRVTAAKERLKKAMADAGEAKKRALQNSYVKEMSDAQMKKREEIVKSMKSKTDEFKSRYGDRWKEVMYATATKQAMSEGFFKVDIEGLPKFFMDAPSADRVKVELRKILKRPNDMITSIDRVQRAEIIKTFRLQAQGKGDDVVGMEPTEESVIHEGVMTLKDGSTIKLTVEQAKLLNNLYKNLNGSNKKKMEEKMMSDKTSFSEIINFAREAV